ncbi:DmsC/YnfH family molybdoenzyme membrane anchor subunit [Neobacillus sp. OS1-32]|jgi:DMSO reductase anchor subunit|uniref:Dimethyl sulfoxide reductase anchor subunit n=1 Tax=Neobacillus paridis TaxID=2803862 RepID=A0ABS1TWI6_9BACI|nr:MULTISPECIES: DmsC/YnfH family molybdoenzyme membrane anchor subunit [Neobacillus]MBL4954656.1 dimethyl sulfoxide reductase anchor subunit [Neobacillus paridis]WML29929.1 DmsC/YnfH family molybdoenzyme membrane anchor subunit [Neobacillus sp. OS1-32]
MSELPISLIVFTYLSDISAGTFIFYLLYQAFFSGNATVEKIQQRKGGIFTSIDAKVSVLSIILLGIGMLASALHLGHPFRFLNALHNPNSMITQEAYWSIGFGILLLIVTIWAFKGKKPSFALNLLTALAGLGLLTVTALAYAKPKGIPAWNQGLTPIIFIISALIMGSVVFLLLLVLQSNDTDVLKKMVFIFLGLLFIQFFVEIAYSIQLSMGTYGVELPDLLTLNISRWLIGLLAPLVVLFALFKKSLKMKTGITLIFATIIIGEGISRIIFFMNGVHL